MSYYSNKSIIRQNKAAKNYIESTFLKSDFKLSLYIVTSEIKGINKIDVELISLKH